MQSIVKFLSTTTLIGLMLASPSLAAPKVVASIKPVHSLVASIMDGVGEPEVILGGNGSPHTYQMKPSDASKLENADVIFWIGHGMEVFLDKPLESLGNHAKIVALDEGADIEKLSTRESGTFEPHDDGEEHEADGHEEFDPHIFLSTVNAKIMAREIADTLAAADPDNAATYQANLVKLNGQLDQLASEIKATLAPVKDKPFIVFHDAYQYFQKEFGVSIAGSITVSPENMPGAERISTIHTKVAELNATCVFAEPQFEPKLIDVVLEGTSAKRGTLDPEASTLPAGKELYFSLMRSIAENISNCLK